MLSAFTEYVGYGYFVAVGKACALLQAAYFVRGLGNSFSVNAFYFIKKDCYSFLNYFQRARFRCKAVIVFAAVYRFPVARINGIAVQRDYVKSYVLRFHVAQFFRNVLLVFNGKFKSFAVGDIFNRIVVAYFFGIFNLCAEVAVSNV